MAMCRLRSGRSKSACRPRNSDSHTECDPKSTKCQETALQDLRLLSLRGAFDPKRFYRNPDSTKFPKYFQFGTVVEGPTEFYSGVFRLAKRLLIS